MPLKAGDLFAGCGGFTIASEKAGLRVSWAVNHWPEALKYHQINHAETAHKRHNLFEPSAAWFSELEDIDVLTASPSCVGFSLARHTSTVATDRSQEMLRATPFAVIAALSGMARKNRLPKLVVVENVRPFLKWGVRPDVDDGSQYALWRDWICKFGYGCQEVVLDAADVGVPQNRVRLFVVFTLGTTPKIAMPTETHVGFGCCVDLDDSGDWSPVKGYPKQFAKARLIAARDTHPDEKALIVNFDTKSKGRPLTRPIGTITTSAYGQWAVMKKSRRGDVFRYLSVNEFKRAMDFPDSYVLPESKVAAGALLGNAVVPRAAEYVIRGGLEAVL